MKIEFETFAKSDFWMFVIIPEFAIFRDKAEFGFELCWLCFCLSITNK